MKCHANEKNDNVAIFGCEQKEAQNNAMHIIEEPPTPLLTAFLLHSKVSVKLEWDESARAKTNDGTPEILKLRFWIFLNW